MRLFSLQHSVSFYMHSHTQLIIPFCLCLHFSNQLLRFKVWSSLRPVWVYSHEPCLAYLRLCVGALSCLCGNIWCLWDSLDWVLHNFRSAISIFYISPKHLYLLFHLSPDISSPFTLLLFNSVSFTPIIHPPTPSTQLVGQPGGCACIWGA